MTLHVQGPELTQRKPVNVPCIRQQMWSITRIELTYYTSSVHVGYILINYTVKYTLVFLSLNRYHTSQTGDTDVIFV